MFLAILILLLSVVFLYFGAELSLESSEVLGKKMRLSPLVVGMLLIGLGTSLPELFVAHIASLEGKTAIATGTLVGSNIANILLILSVAALFTKLSLKSSGLRGQIIIHLVLTLTLVVLFQFHYFGLIAAAVLLSICFTYLWMIFRSHRSELKEEFAPEENAGSNLLLMTRLFFGFGLLYLGGEGLVQGATRLGSEIGISEYIVSSLFVAFGTSFPELVTALLSAYKKKDTDLIIGNVLGSNLFNCSLILGSISFYQFSFSENFYVESIALVLGAAYLLLLSLMKRDFFRLSAALGLLLYTGVVMSWLGVFPNEF